MALLQRGSRGPDVIELRRQLRALGYELLLDTDSFDENLEQALINFQYDRKIRADGICGPETYRALEEAKWKLGDRLLFRKSPMMRGDDVLKLQVILSSLGFDPGRVDGIFGDLTQKACIEFQKNVCLAADGIVGPDTLKALLRVTPRETTNTYISDAKNNFYLNEQNPANLTLALIPLTEAADILAGLKIQFELHGFKVLLIDHSDQSSQAFRVNESRASIVIAVSVRSDCNGINIIYYSGPHYESFQGRLISSKLQALLSKDFLGTKVEVTGMYLPILRETTCVAIIIELCDQILDSVDLTRLAGDTVEAISTKT